MSHLPSNEGGNFTPPPAGTFPSICYRVIDLGTQKTSYLGRIKHQHKVLLSWEIKDDEAMMETDDGPKPMTIHQRYTWSTHEKASLRKDLESWRGKTFTEEDFGPEGFDIKNVIGVGCLLGITHNAKDGKVYANISSVAKLPKSMDAGELQNPKTYLWLTSDLFSRETFSDLSESLQDTIRSSPEYQTITNGKGEEPYMDADNDMTDEINDEIPF